MIQEKHFHLIDYRRALHQCAEIGFTLPKTRKIIEDRLDRAGVEHQRVGRGSVVARIGEGKCGVLLRADMDALPMSEETGEEYACANGNMHACGHDMHTAMLLGAVLALSEKKQISPYEIRFLFQASEENLMGAHDAISYGVLDKWENIRTENDGICKQLLENQDDLFIKCAFSLHCMTGVPLKTGEVIVGDGGVVAPASSYFTLRIFGKSAHGGAPHMGRDALLALMAIYNAYGSLAQNSVSSKDQPLITVGEVHSGDAANVVPSHAYMRGTVRSMSDMAQEKLIEKMKEAAMHISRAYGVTSEFSVEGYAPTLKNDADLSRCAHFYLKKFFSPTRVKFSSDICFSEGGKRIGGSEDFAHFSHIVPSLLIALAAGDSREGYTYPLHHPKVRFDENALMIGASIYEALAMFDIATVIPVN